MAGDTPHLDWVANDLFYDLFTAVLTLDALVPRGTPSADVCGCCEGDTFRMREQRRRMHVAGGRSRVYRVCSRCDRSSARMWLPRGWTA